MRKLIVSEWVSLDGIYDASTMDQWWNPYDSSGRQGNIQEIINDCDTMLYGRKTYEMLWPYWSAMKDNEMGVAHRLNTVKKYVISKTLRKGEWENSNIVSTAVMETIKGLKSGDGGNILVIGSATLVAGLMQAGLVDELKLLVQPYIMGRGERFFLDEMQGAIELVNSSILDKGVLSLSYKIASKI